MHPRSTLAPALLGAILLCIALCQPAEARRRFGFGFGGGGGYSEKIDRVYDLPDREPYFNDGKYYDIGYFYSVNKTLGITTSSTRAGGKYVLYNGDRYTVLDAQEIAMISADLGTDPIGAHRRRMEAQKAIAAPTTSKNAIERREGESREAFLARVRGMQAKSGKAGEAEPAASSAGGGGMAGALLGMLMIGAIGFGMYRMLRRKPGRTGATDDCDAEPVDSRSFDERVSERLRELRESQGGMSSAAPAPGVRTFGRRLA